MASLSDFRVQSTVSSHVNFFFLKDDDKKINHVLRLCYDCWSGCSLNANLLYEAGDGSNGLLWSFMLGWTVLLLETATACLSRNDLSLTSRYIHCHVASGQYRVNRWYKMNGFCLLQPAVPVSPAITTTTPTTTAGTPQQQQQQQQQEQQLMVPPQVTSGGSLDSMLGLLQSDLSRQGVQTSSKGNCSACQKPVVGQVSARQLPGSRTEVLRLHGETISLSKKKKKSPVAIYCVTVAPPPCRAGGDGPGQGVAPRALCVHGMRDGVGQPQLL